MTTIQIVGLVLILAASVTGLALKDVRLHGASLAISLVLLVLYVVGRH